MQNRVRLVGHYGNDEIIACAAWTSTGTELTEEKRTRIPGLLKMLVTGSDGNGHTTPFERSLLHFQVTCDTASHIHFLKHRVGWSINGESARYKEYTEDKYLIPQDWTTSIQADLVDHCETAFDLYHSTIARLVASGVDRKRAKESARFFLPYATQINLDMSCNFSAFVHFQKLRNAPSAQKEIREIAAEMLRLVKTETNNDFQHSLEAWGL
jgi:flavin-dependent thymidylate synthase